MKPSVKKNINYLIDLTLAKGVKLSDLTDNIFDDAYKTMKITKNATSVCLDLSFIEEIDSKKINVKYRYVYDNDQTLMVIENTSRKKKEIVWSRIERESELLNQIIKELDPNEKETFLDTLPDSLKKRQVVSLSKVS